MQIRELKLKSNMPNIAPIAILKITPSELTLTGSYDKVLLSGSASYDPNKRGVIAKYEFFLDGNLLFSGPDSQATLLNPPIGSHKIKLQVTDKRGMKGAATVDLTVHPFVALPVAVLKVTPSEITLTAADDTVLLDGSATTGSIDKYEFYSDLQLLSSGTNKQASIINPIAGTFLITLVATDVYSRTSEASVNLVVHPEVVVIPPPPDKTMFGANGPTVPDVSTLKLLNGKISRTNITLDQGETKSDRADKFLSAGIPMVININNRAVQKDSNGNKIPNPYVTASELDDYEKKLRAVFAYYKGKDVYLACENEPTQTNSFHSGPAKDYLAQLTRFCNVGKEYGLRCMDGALHVETINGANTGEGSSSLASEFLNGYKYIDNLWGLLIHTSTKTNNYQDGAIQKAVQKEKDVTGIKNIASNEWHVEGLTYTEAIKEITDQWAAAGVLFSIYITGTNPDGILNNGNDLTPIGRTYRDEIARIGLA